MKISIPEVVREIANSQYEIKYAGRYNGYRVFTEKHNQDEDYGFPSAYLYKEGEPLGIAEGFDAIHILSKCK